MELSALVTKSIDHHNKGKSRVQASNTNRGAEAGAESNEQVTTNHETAYNAGLTDLKLEKANVMVSGLSQATAVKNTNANCETNPPLVSCCARHRF